MHQNLSVHNTFAAPLSRDQKNCRENSKLNARHSVAGKMRNHFKMHLNVPCIGSIENERPIHTMNRILSIFVVDSPWHCTKLQSAVLTYQRTPLTAIKPNKTSSFEFSTTSRFCLNRFMVADQTRCNPRGTL